MIYNVNFLAVFVAALVNMGVGYAWYGPLFGKMWMKLTGRTKQSMEKDKKEMPKVMIYMLAGAIIMAFVLSLFVKWAGVTSATGGATIGFWAWLGFVAITMLQDVLYEKKNAQLASINLGYNLAVLVINGAILAVWH